MAETLSELLGGINAKCDILASRCRTLEEQNRKLSSELSDSREALESMRKELEKAQRQLNYQVIASNYDSGARDTSRQSSKIISDMVRKIDRCISRLEAE